MFAGVPLIERVKRLVETQMSILETWSDGSDPEHPQGLTPEQLDQLKTLAMIARQLDLDSVESAQAPAAASSTSIDDLLSSLPAKK